MALFRKRYTSFGREDKLVGVRALLKGDSFLIRVMAFVVCAAVFLLIVEVTHRDASNASDAGETDSTEVVRKK